MSKRFQIGFLFLSILVLMGAGPAKKNRMTLVATDAVTATCYNDDSLDPFNQDEVGPPNPKLGRLPNYPRPDDCASVPMASGDDRGALRVGGRPVYQSPYAETIKEVRGTPDGIFAVLLSGGSLVLLTPNKNGEYTSMVWFHAGLSSDSIQEFKLSRSGEVIAKSLSGMLVVGGQIDKGSDMVRELKASRSGRVIAVMQSGEIVDGTHGASGTPIRHHDQEMVSVTKIAADGTVVWLTNRGVLASSRQGILASDPIDPVKSFHVNASGRVVSLSSDEVLRRDSFEIDRFGSGHVGSYRVEADGTVRVFLSAGGMRVFR